jgi:hypothetical protein
VQGTRNGAYASDNFGSSVTESGSIPRPCQPPSNAAKPVAAGDLHRELQCILVGFTSRIAKEYGCDIRIAARVGETNESLGRLVTYWNVGSRAIKQQLLSLPGDRRCHVGVRMTSAADAMAAIEIKIIASSGIEDPIAFSLYKREWEKECKSEAKAES